MVSFASGVSQPVRPCASEPTGALGVVWAEPKVCAGRFGRFESLVWTVADPKAKLRVWRRMEAYVTTKPLTECSGPVGHACGVAVTIIVPLDKACTMHDRTLPITVTTCRSAVAAPACAP